MTVLVGQYGIDLTAERHLVDAATAADVLGKQYLVHGMLLLLPGGIVAEMILVVTLNLAALNMKESC